VCPVLCLACTPEVVAAGGKRHVLMHSNGTWPGASLHSALPHK
jgi:hypothetical protein